MELFLKILFLIGIFDIGMILGYTIGWLAYSKVNKGDKHEEKK